MRFPKSLRLRKRAEYVVVQRAGQRRQGRCFLLMTTAGELTRVGVTVSKKVGNAVVRNRIKRCVREYVRRHKAVLPVGDSVVIAKRQAAQASSTVLRGDLARLFTREGPA